MPASLFVSGMNDDPLNCAPGGANKARMPSQRKCTVHSPESRRVKLHLSNKLQVLNCRAICFLAQTPGCAAIRHHKKSPRFFFFHNEPIPKREAHLSLPFYTGPVSDALFSIQAVVFIQLFDSSKRASGEIPTERASRCSLPRRALHF